MRRRSFLASPAAFAFQSNPERASLLRYNQPANQWIEALPIGNGTLGAMVFGGTEVERLQLNEDSLWAGAPKDRNNPKALGALPKVRELLFAGQHEAATKLAAETMMGVPNRIQSYEPLGELWIESSFAAPVTDYSRQLDLRTAVAGTRFQTGGTLYEREALASYPDRLIAVRLQCNRRGRLNTRISLRRERDARIIGSANRLLLSGKLEMRFAAVLRVEQKGGTLENRGDSIVVSQADEILLLLQAATSYRVEDPVAHCEEAISKVSSDFDGIRNRHIEDYGRLFRSMELELGDPNPALEAMPADERLQKVKAGGVDTGLEELLFQYGRYLLISSSRPGSLPANLQGIWNPHLKAPWNSDFHTNINLQMNYWPADVTNLSECHQPLFDYMELLAREGSKTAKVHYGARGWVVHHLSDPFGFCAPADGVQGIWPMGAAWLARHPWEHYQFTRDKKFLAERGWPLMREAARFIMDFLIPGPNGKLVTNPSHSPENRFRTSDGQVSMFTYAATMDLEICHDLLKNCIAATKELGTDREFREECEKKLAQLQPLQISKRTGRLMEWIEDYEEPEPHHRHTSHLYGLHPGDQITRRGTPELFEAARKSLLARGDISTGWSMAWKMNFWARFEDGNHAYKLLTDLLRNGILPNLFDTHPPFQIDGNFGATAGIAEMLVQSHAGEIHILPALPDAWPQGKVRGLRARGGIELNFEWRNGKLTRLEAKPDSAQTVRFRYGSRERSIPLVAGRSQNILI